MKQLILFTLMLADLTFAHMNTSAESSLKRKILSKTDTSTDAKSEGSNILNPNIAKLQVNIMRNKKENGESNVESLTNWLDSKYPEKDNSSYIKGQKKWNTLNERATESIFDLFDKALPHQPKEYAKNSEIIAEGINDVDENKGVSTTEQTKEINEASDQIIKTSEMMHDKELKSLENLFETKKDDSVVLNQVDGYLKSRHSMIEEPLKVHKSILDKHPDIVEKEKKFVKDTSKELENLHDKAYDWIDELAA